MITLNFKIQSFTLKTKYFDERHSGENILAEIHKIENEFHLKDKTISMVTDAGGNVCRAVRLGNYEHHMCIGHALHNLITVDRIKNVQEILDIVNKVRSIIKEIRYKTSEFEKQMVEEEQRLHEQINNIDDEVMIDLENGQFEIVEDECEESNHSSRSLNLDVKTKLSVIYI